MKKDSNHDKQAQIPLPCQSNIDKGYLYTHHQPIRNQEITPCKELQR